MNIGFKDINELSQSLISKNTIEENLYSVINNIENEIPFQSLGIFLRNNEDNLFHIKAHKHLSPTFIKNHICKDSDKIVHSLQSFQSLRYSDNRMCFEYIATDLIIFPLYYHVDLIGFVFIDRQKDYFSDYEIEKINVYCSLLSLILKIKQLQLELEQTNEMDSNTGFYNHKGFIKNCIKKHAVLARYNRTYTLSLVKIKKLEEVSQAFGSHKLSLFLQEISNLIKKNIRDTDFAGILYPDTFAIFLYEVNKIDGEKVINRIHNSIVNNPRFIAIEFEWAINDNSTKEQDFVQIMAETEKQLL